MREFGLENLLNSWVAASFSRRTLDLWRWL